MSFAGFLCELSGEAASTDSCLACACSGVPGCEIGSPAIIAGIAGNQHPPDFALAAASDERLNQRYQELLAEEGDPYNALRRLIEETSPRKSKQHFEM